MSTPFALADDGVDPAQIPARRLVTGAKLPAIGLGTFGSDHVDHADVARAVRSAAALGYRHFDCASVYGNEAHIGRTLAGICTVIPRDDLWVTSKLWNDAHAPADVAPACRQSLRDLGLEYLDLYLVHWPFPHHHAPGCEGDVRDPNARPWDPARFLETWRAMEQLVDEGLVRHIGTSNMTVPKLEALLPETRIRPAANQLELHPHFQQPALFEYLQDQGIAPVGYCPIGSPARPERDRTAEDTVDIEDPTLRAIAAAHDLHPATLCVKWAAQRGQTPIPFSTRRANLLANLRALTTPALTADEMAAIAAVDRNCRLIKGQVFLWEGASGWQDLWDDDPLV